ALLSSPCPHSHIRYTVEMFRAADMPLALRASVWDILAANMQHLYVSSSMGWDPEEKKLELFHANSRFILLRPATAPEASSPSDGAAVAAYSMFRFEMEFGERLLYCYEVQVSKDAQRCGLGRQLMQFLRDIGKRWQMEKVMLTVLKANDRACALYKSIGFEVDPTSPGYEDDEGADEEEEPVDYWIMSQKLF
ncbi:acyl-CoA N-acyltransferase, partial [Auriscalpium vulgare]